ncbi:MAG: hypothetical protein ABSG84_02030 [Acidobacteriaceae bacterium]|jgi:uncharacterized membrane protein YfcA
MSAAASLPARILYTVVAVPLGGAAGFYSIMLLLPRLVARYPNLNTGLSGQEMYNLAVGVGAGLAFTVALFALTLPWIRHRKRSGRGWRVGLSCVLVVVTSAGFAAEVRRLIPDLVFAAWLTYTLAYTFVRYGVVDDAKRTFSSRYY